MNDKFVNMVFKIGVLLIGVGFLVACAHSSGVLNVGPGTYSVSVTAPSKGVFSEARKIALTEANQHCMQMRKEIMVTNIETSNYGPGEVTVTFRCQ